MTAVIYLTGVTNDRIEPTIIAQGDGLMIQQGNSYHLRVLRYPFWAADNGCFADTWIEQEWAEWIEQLPTTRCLFAVAPDVYPDAGQSLVRGLAFAPEMRALGFPVAVVAQDGAERLHWPWDELDCLFIGGEKRTPGWKEWKESEAAAELAREARNAGKWVHMGRVNSERRYMAADRMGCLSVDGTFIKYRKRKLQTDSAGERHGRGEAELAKWHAASANSPTLWTWESPSHAAHKAALPEPRKESK